MVGVTLLSAGATRPADAPSLAVGAPADRAVPVQGLGAAVDVPLNAGRRPHDLALELVLGAGALFSLVMFVLAALPRRLLVALRLGAVADRSSDLALWGFVVAASIAVGLVVVSVGP